MNLLSQKQAKLTHQRMLFPAPATKLRNQLIAIRVEMDADTHDCHRPIKWSHLSSILEMCCPG
jgi:hypothetical protein